MAKGIRKITSFLWAMLVAILSFFIIFIFFPDVSNKFFGVSIKGEDVQKVVTEVTDSVKDKATQAITDTINDTVDQVVNQVVQETTDSVAETLNRLKNNE